MGKEPNRPRYMMRSNVSQVVVCDTRANHFVVARVSYGDSDADDVETYDDALLLAKKIRALFNSAKVTKGGGNG